MTDQPEVTTTPAENFDWKGVIDAALTECGLERIAPLKLHQRGMKPVFTAHIVPVERWRSELKLPSIIRALAKRDLYASVTELPRIDNPFQRPPVGALEIEELR
jgi:hypothetical protein